MVPLGPGLADYARLAERLGFEYLTCGEHLSTPGPVANAFISLAAAAGATSSIGLVSCATLVPLYQPALLAKLVASLDAVSQGRFHLGVGVGGEYPAEFALAGVPVAGRGARTDEALRLMRELFAGSDVTGAGDVAGAGISPRPEAGAPEFWIAGRGAAAWRRAARLGQAWMPYLVSPDQVARGSEQIQAIAAKDGATRDGAASDGQPGWAGRLAPMIFITTGRDGDEARAALERRLSRIYGRDFSGPARAYAIAGTPAECRAALTRYVEAGASVLLLRVLAPVRQMAGMTSLIADEVAWPLRAEHGSAR
jgi:alkanesulfonate monooxygenase SsuD/methylene tetrahydromethanopterin reductase-like flavin-dependent oxidoreductase (luciferase family)